MKLEINSNWPTNVTQSFWTKTNGMKTHQHTQIEHTVHQSMPARARFTLFFVSICWFVCLFRKCFYLQWYKIVNRNTHTLNTLRTCTQVMELCGRDAQYTCVAWQRTKQHSHKNTLKKFVFLFAVGVFFYSRVIVCALSGTPNEWLCNFLRCGCERIDDSRVM